MQSKSIHPKNCMFLGYRATNMDQTYFVAIEVLFQAAPLKTLKSITSYHLTLTPKQHWSSFHYKKQHLQLFT